MRPSDIKTFSILPQQRRFYIKAGAVYGALSITMITVVLLWLYQSFIIGDYDPAADPLPLLILMISYGFLATPPVLLLSEAFGRIFASLALSPQGIAYQRQGIVLFSSWDNLQAIKSQRSLWGKSVLLTTHAGLEFISPPIKTQFRGKSLMGMWDAIPLQLFCNEENNELLAEIFKYRPDMER